MKTPDPNARAPRPSRKLVDDEQKPVADSPPLAQPRDQPSFDRGVAAANKDAATGQRPGKGDSAAVHAEGTADTPDTERAKHNEPTSHTKTMGNRGE